MTGYCLLQPPSLTQTAAHIAHSNGGEFTTIDENANDAHSCITVWSTVLHLCQCKTESSVTTATPAGTEEILHSTDTKAHNPSERRLQ